MFSDKIGYGFRGVRNDGRVFVGTVLNVANTVRGVLLIIKQANNEVKSVYAHDLSSWSASLANGQPVLLGVDN